MKIPLLYILIFAGLLLVTILIKGEIIECKTIYSNCDSTELFLNQILLKKVKYEKDLFYNDTANIADDGKKYFDMVNLLKSKKEYYIGCCNFILKNKANDSKLVEYTYYPSYLNNTPECKYINYNQFILLIIYNLEHLKENEMELECENEIFGR